MDQAAGRVMAQWGLVADGAAFATASSLLVPVRRDGVAAMLKIARTLEEARGGRAMQWWDGHGMAPVLARRGPALLMARGGGSLAGLEEDQAVAVLCGVARRLHAAAGVPPRLVGLRRWFRALLAWEGGGEIGAARAVAEGLLADPRDEGALHGDLHHGNVLNFGVAGWLAIDPKGLWGERGFDYANLFRNPDAATALVPGRMARRAEIVAGLAGLERGRLLDWVVALCGLSACWRISGGGDAADDLAVMRAALREAGACR